MNIGHQVARLSISRQVLLTALLPLLLLTLALSISMITSRVQDARQGLHEQSETLLGFLASASELALLTESHDAFEQLAREPLKQAEVTDILFYNANYKRLYSGDQHTLDVGRLITISSSNSGYQRFELPGLENTWAIVQPVISYGVGVDDFDGSQARGRHLGWVVVLLNERALIKQQRQILLKGVLLSIVALLLAVALAHRISRNISQPIIELSRNLERYQQGDYQIRTEEDQQQEIGALQRGINTLIEQVQRHQQHLQREVDDATGELQSALVELEQSNRKLQLSKDKVELTGQAKDQFMARMSHELRTPISSVLGFVQLLEKSPLDEAQHEYCRIIHNASELLLRLIDDVLDFSKFQSDNPSLERIAFNPEQSIEDVVEMQAPAAAEKGVRLEFNCDAQWSLCLLGDPTRFAQVITNLVANAIKFTEAGSVKVLLSSQQQDRRTLLQIKVEDSGIGITAEQLPGLFQPFSQADTSINRRFGGTGLGLVISKRLVELMGGELNLSSVPGEGTCFRISLWLDNAPPTAQSVLPALNVLLCCSDTPCRERYQHLLKQWGCRVDSLADRQQLVATLANAEQSYDRVVVHLTVEELKVLSWNQFLNPVRKCFDGELILIAEHSGDLVTLGIDRLLKQLAPARILMQPVGRHRIFRALQATDLESPAEIGDKPALEGISILLAEDNRFNRLLISRMLQAQGALVYAVENGHDAWVKARQKAFDLILMDLHMPVLDGAQACKKIRQLPSVSDTPIVLLTADVVTDERELLKTLQLQGVLYKPVDEVSLVQRILALTQPEPEAQQSEVKVRMQRFGISQQELKHALDELFEAMQQALLQGDRQSLRDHAHQLAGVTAMAGLSELDDQLQLFRQAIRNERISDIWQRYWKMKECYE